MAQVANTATNVYSVDGTIHPVPQPPAVYLRPLNALESGKK